MEWYIQQSKLIEKSDWNSQINDLKNNTIKGTLLPVLTDAVKKRITKENAVLFSGGIDSTIIALLLQKLGANFKCYTVGFQDSNFKKPEDIVWAKKVAKELGFVLESKIFTLNEMKKIFIRTVNILGKHANVVTVGVGSVIIAANLGNEKNWFSGLGSEEIFAGYERHKQNPANEECWNGLISMYKRDLIRDSIIAKKLGITISTPFLDKELIRTAMNIPIEMKIKGDNNKIVLREAAIQLGMPKEFAMRKKRAAQYGSSFDRALAKLAKISGFKYKKDYIESLRQ